MSSSACLKLAEEARADLGDSLTKRQGTGVRPCGVWQSTAGNQPEYDLLIRGGRIVDGTGNPWFRGDVAVRGDKIVAVGRVPAGQAKREIDATGLVVAPGFIDMHSHSDTLLLEDGHAQSKIRQGVTTEVLGEGTSAGPRVGKLSPQTDARRRASPSTWRTLGDYFHALEEARTSRSTSPRTSASTTSGKSVMGAVARAADAGAVRRDEEARRRGDARRRVRPVDDAGDAARLAGHDRRPRRRCARSSPKHGGIYSTHIRNEGTGVFDAIKEAIAVGERAGVPVDIIHLKIADQKYWGRMKRDRRADRRGPRARRERADQRLSLHARQQQPRRASSRPGPTKGARASCSRG